MKFNAEIRSHRCAMRGPVIGVFMKSVIDVQRNNGRQGFTPGEFNQRMEEAVTVGTT